MRHEGDEAESPEVDKQEAEGKSRMECWLVYP